MKRVVPIVVTDDRVTDLFVESWANEPQENGSCLSDDTMPVSSDDQLAHDLDRVTRAMPWNYDPGEIEHEAAARIRAAFQLDEVES